MRRLSTEYEEEHKEKASGRYLTKRQSNKLNVTFADCVP